MWSPNKQTNSQDPQLNLCCPGAAGEHGEQRAGDWGQDDLGHYDKGQDDLGHDNEGQDDLGHDDEGQDVGHPRLSLSLSGDLRQDRADPGRRPRTSQAPVRGNQEGEDILEAGF